MRSGKFFFVLSLTILVSVAMWGCSDDSKPTTSLPTEQDYNYQAVQSEIDDAVASAFVQIAEGMMKAAQPAINEGEDIRRVGAGEEPPAEDGYWYVKYNTNLATAFSLSRVDSLQFSKDGQVQRFGIGSDMILLRHYLTVECADTTGEFRNIDARVRLQITGLNTPEATINGERRVNVEVQTDAAGSTWRRNLSIVTVFNDVTARPMSRAADICPNSGSVTGLITLSSSRDDAAPVQSEWAFSATIENGAIEGTVSSGTYSRTFARTVCE